MTKNRRPKSTPQVKETPVSYEDIQTADAPAASGAEAQGAVTANEIVSEGHDTSGNPDILNVTIPANSDALNAKVFEETDKAADEILDAALEDGHLVKTGDENFESSAEPSDLVAKINAMAPGSTSIVDAAPQSAKLGIEDGDKVALPVEEAKNPDAIVSTIPAGFAQTPAIPVDPHQLPLSASASARLTIQELKDYIEQMSSKVRRTVEQGGQAQAHLYHTLLQAINSPAADFDATFGLTMRIIRDNLTGVFSFENLHRYTPHATLPANKMAHFRYLLSVLTALADPSTRAQALRQTNLDKAFLVPAIKEDARQRVLNFFNV